jgi:hypothetical protein
MPDWLLTLLAPVLTGAVSGLVVVAGLRVDVRNIKDSAMRAHVRIDDHIDRHHVGSFPRINHE